jgi:hypothetical protein
MSHRLTLKPLRGHWWHAQCACGWNVSGEEAQVRRAHAEHLARMLGLKPRKPGKRRRLRNKLRLIP